MAKVGITLSYRGGENVPVLRSTHRASEAKTSSGTSQASTAVAQTDEYWSIATDGNIWVTFAAAPVAVAGTGYMLTVGVYNFEAAAGDKVALIDA